MTGEEGRRSVNYAITFASHESQTLIRCNSADARIASTSFRVAEDLCRDETLCDEEFLFRTAVPLYAPCKNTVPPRSFFRGLAHRSENNIRTLRLCLPTFFSLFFLFVKRADSQQQIHDRPCVLHAHRPRLKSITTAMGHTLNGRRVPHKSRIK